MTLQLARWRGDTAPENFGIYSFTEHDRFDFFTPEERIRAAMYMPCIKCSCSELKLAKHLHYYFIDFDIKLKKSRSVFNLVTVLISKQSFFQHPIWSV